MTRWLREGVGTRWDRPRPNGRARVGLVLLLLVVALAAATARAQETGGEPEADVMHTRVVELFQKGGILMWPILLCSVVMFAYVLERAVALRARAVFPPRLLEEARDLVEQGRTDAVLHLSDGNAAPFGRLLHACLSRADASGFEMEAALEEAGTRVLYDLRRNTRPLGVIADVAPLLGLMGTVFGMIKAFTVVAKSGALGRAELLAEGISEALLTTAFGLTVAIPAMIFYHYFRGKADNLLRAMEDACIDILTRLRRIRKAE